MWFVLIPALAAKPAESLLVFAWPDGLDVPVRVDVKEVVEAGSEARRRCFSVSAHLRTQRDTAGLRVWLSEPVDEIPADECPQFVELRPFLPPRFVVGTDGAIVAVEGEQDRETRELWNRVVEFWAGRTATREPDIDRVTRALPSLGWEPNDLVVTATLTDARKKGDRVELALELVPDPTDVVEYFRRLHSTAPELGGAVGAATLGERIVVAADPRTLLPTSWTETLAVSLTMADPPGTARRTVETTWTFAER